MGMHLREGPGGGPVSARVGGQAVYADWSVPLSCLMEVWYLTPLKRDGRRIIPSSGMAVTASQVRKNASCMHGYLSGAEHAYSEPNWPRSAQARDANGEGGFSVLSVAKHIQNNDTLVIGVSHDASLMFASIMMILRLNQAF